MLASLTIALGLAVLGNPQYGGHPVAPPPIPANPSHGMRVPAHAAAGHAIPRGVAHHGVEPGGFILPQPGPGDGWGFPNGAPDGYGWYDPGTSLPIREDRTTSYYFRRYMAVPPETMFLPNYYNPFVTRGQRYIPYVGMGGWHAAGGAPTGSAAMPVTPYSDLAREVPPGAVPAFSGEVQATPINPGQVGRTIRD